MRNRLTTLLRERSFWLAIGGVVVVLWLIFSRYGIVTRLRLEHQSSELDRIIELQYHTNDSLAQYRQRLERDTLLLEKLARERYGMVRPGETVFIIVDSTR